MTPNNQIPEEEQEWQWPPNNIDESTIRLEPPRRIEGMSRQEPEPDFTEKLLLGSLAVLGAILVVMLSMVFGVESSNILLEAGIITGIPSVLHIPVSLVILLGMTIAVVSFVYCVGDAVERVFS